MTRTKPVVGVVMGSDSDWPVMKETVALLATLKVPSKVRVLSAHRTPEKAVAFAIKAEVSGIRIIIAAAGGAAHLAGVIASHVTLPVIGVPIEGRGLSGLDALLSTVQMPAGVPVATVAIGKAGARNAAILAAEILALSDERLKAQLHLMRIEARFAVMSKDKAIRREVNSLVRAMIGKGLLREMHSGAGDAVTAKHAAIRK
jgi:phosphoribosylaminoimidazole carboxylase PurE protein